MTNLLTYGDLSKKDISLAEYNLQSLQEEFVEWFDELSVEIKAEPSTKVREKIMTNADKEMASQVHDLALALYRYFTYGEKSDLIQSEKYPVKPLVIGILLLALAFLAGFALTRRRAK